MMRPLYSICLSFICIPYSLFPQAKINNLFVNSTENIVRLDFSNGTPTVNYLGFGSGVGIGEGIAHAEDENGQVIILVNSSGIYDRDGNKMPGSTGILAHPSSTEIVICRKPSSESLFYVVYNNQLCSSLMYSIVDIEKRNGLGDIVELNHILDNGRAYAEGLEIIGRPCTSDLLLIAYRCNDGFVKFELSGDGFSEPTLIHAMNTNNHGGRGELDYRKGKLGYGITFTNKAFLADFDPIIGTISNPQIVTFPATNGIYGLEFSAQATNVYVTDLDNRDIFGNINSPNLFSFTFATGYISSWTLNYQSINCTAGDPQGLGQIEIGKDLNLYLPVIGGCKLYIVAQADTNPIIQQIETASVLSAGLSDHIKSEFLEEYGSPIPFVYSAKDQLILCKDESILLETELLPSLSYQWYYNGSTMPNETNSSVRIDQPGEYHVYVRDQNDCGVPSPPVTVEGTSLRPIELGGDTVICYDKPLTLKIDEPGALISWNDGDNASQKIIRDSGNYSVIVNNQGCIEIDSINITVIKGPENNSIPNVITPNGDPFNEHLIIADDLLSGVQLKIFNRWGCQVYSNPDYKNQWSGSNLPSGVYYYEVKTGCRDLKGWIQVLK